MLHKNGISNADTDNPLILSTLYSKDQICKLLIYQLLSIINISVYLYQYEKCLPSANDSSELVLPAHYLDNTFKINTVP